MSDKWFAECRPCAWSTTHDIQDDAIRAAEDHVFTNHRAVPPIERLAQGIGHVQNRTLNAVPMPAEPAASVSDATGDSSGGPFVPNVS